MLLRNAFLKILFVSSLNGQSDDSMLDKEIVEKY